MQGTDCGLLVLALRVYIAPPYALAVPHSGDAGAQHLLLRPLHGLRPSIQAGFQGALPERGVSPEAGDAPLSPQLCPRGTTLPPHCLLGGPLGRSRAVALAFCRQATLARTQAEATCMRIW